MERVKGYLNQEYEKIKHDCLVSKTLFTDEKFPANNSSLFKLVKKPNIQWKRPFEILLNPKFSTIDFDLFDLENDENW